VVNLEEVKSLCSDPAVNVNWQSEDGFTALSCACHNGHSLVVEHLLAHPKIDPNLSGNEGATPILVACEKGHKEVVSVMLADPRVDPNRPKKTLSTPLWFACQNDHLVVVQLLLASGREIDTKMISTYNDRTAAEQGRAMEESDEEDDDDEDDEDEDDRRGKIFGPKCADLIDEYEKDADGVRTRLRRELGLPGSFIFQFLFASSFHSPVLIDRFDLSALKRPLPTPEEKSGFLERLRGKKRGKVTGMMSFHSESRLINSSDCPNILNSCPADGMSPFPPRNQRSQNPPLSSLLLPQMPREE